MLKLLQVWQYGLPTAAEKTLDDAIATAQAFGFTGLLVKALDGASWMNEFDHTPDALGAVEQAQAQHDACKANKLDYYVWTNPHTDDWQTQADVTAQLALVTDGVFLDVEPYPGFWGPFKPVGLAQQFMERVRSAAAGAFIALQPDPRPQHLEEIRVNEWMELCSALAGQHYWSDFQTDPRDELKKANALAAQFGKDVYPTLPGNAPTASFPLDLLAGFPGFVVFKLGSTPPATLTALGGVKDGRGRRLSAMANSMALRQAFLAEIEQFKGNLYHFGGKSPAEGFDCSGLLTYCGQQVGVDLGDPLMTNADGLKAHCVEVDPGEALLGDLILFHNTFDDPVSGQPFPADYATHCGTSLGAGTLRMWDTHENVEGGKVPGVGETNIGSPFWQGHFLGVWRPTAFLAEEAANGDGG